MQLNELYDNPGARKERIRVGRGIGCGKGKTCGRGFKGQKSRTGVAIKGFEGGQMPIHRRLPKRGFNNHTRVSYDVLTTGDLQRLIDSKRLDGKAAITVEALKAARVVPAGSPGVKLLLKGDLKAKLTVQLTKASAGAAEAVSKAGGSFAAAA